MEEVLGYEEPQCNKKIILWNVIGFVGLGGSVLSALTLVSCDFTTSSADGFELDYPARFGLFNTNVYIPSRSSGDDWDNECEDCCGGTSETCHAYNTLDDSLNNSFPAQCEGHGLAFDDGGPQTAARVCGIVAMILSGCAFMFNLCLFHFRPEEMRGSCWVGGCMYLFAFTLQLLTLLFPRNNWCAENPCKLGIGAALSVIAATLFLVCATGMIFSEGRQYRIRPEVLVATESSEKTGRGSAVSQA